MGEKWSRLIGLREERKLSQADVAKAVGMSRSGFSMYELGEREPDMETICKIASFFGVSADYLIGRTASSVAVEQDPIPLEWRKVIARCREMNLGPEQVLRALTGLSIIAGALTTRKSRRTD